MFCFAGSTGLVSQHSNASLQPLAFVSFHDRVVEVNTSENLLTKFGSSAPICEHRQLEFPASMPKAVLPPLPLSGLFGVIKPSGPTSMSVLEDIKQLVGNSRLFVDARKLENRTGKDRRKRRKDTVKIGQGGTLDPLADGVLGKSTSLPLMSIH